MEVDGWTALPGEEQGIEIDDTDELDSLATASQPKKRRKSQQPEPSASSRTKKKQRIYPVSKALTSSPSSSKVATSVFGSNRSVGKGGPSRTIALEYRVHSPLQPLTKAVLPIKLSQPRASFPPPSTQKASPPSTAVSFENPPRASSVVNISSDDEPAGDPQHRSDTDASTDTTRHESLIEYLSGKRKGKEKQKLDERKPGANTSIPTHPDSASSDSGPLILPILIDLTVDEPEKTPEFQEIAHPEGSVDKSTNQAKSTPQKLREVITLSDDDDDPMPMPLVKPSQSSISIPQVGPSSKKSSPHKTMRNTSMTGSLVESKNAMAASPQKAFVAADEQVLQKPHSLQHSPSSVTVATPITPKPFTSGVGKMSSVLTANNSSGSTHKPPPPISMLRPSSKPDVKSTLSPIISSPSSLRHAFALPRVPQDTSSPVRPTVSPISTPQVSPIRRARSPANAITESLADVSITSEVALPSSNPSSRRPGIFDSYPGAARDHDVPLKTPVVSASASRTGSDIVRDMLKSDEGPNEARSSELMDVFVSGVPGSSGTNANMQASSSSNIPLGQDLSIPNHDPSWPTFDMLASDISDELFADVLRNIEEEEFGYLESMESKLPMSKQCTPPIRLATPPIKRALSPPASTSPVFRMPKMDAVIPELVPSPLKSLPSLASVSGSSPKSHWARKSTGTRVEPPPPKPMSGRRARKTTRRSLSPGVAGSSSPKKVRTPLSSPPIPPLHEDSSTALVPHSETPTPLSPPIDLVQRKARTPSPPPVTAMEVDDPTLPPGHDAKLEEHLMLAAHAQRFLTYENRSWYKLSPRLQHDPAMGEVYEAMISRCTPKEPRAPRIGIVNLVNPEEQRCPPWEFLWTNEVLYGVGVPPTNKNDLHGCDCNGPCDPKSKTCTCIQRQRKMVPELSESGQAFCYNPDGTLKDYLQKTVIIECNSDCLCDDNCVNRTIQQGRKIKINLEKTEKKGWGVFAKQNIKAGTFVGIYSGELIKEEEAERRGMLYGVLGRTYMFDIDFGHLSEFSAETGSVPALSASGSRSSIEMEVDAGPKTPATTSEPAEREILYAVDAFHVGNHTRFLNHSCEPNCYIVAVYIEEPDIERPLLAVFTSDDVKAGQELTFDYAGSAEPKKDDKDESEGEKLAVYAKCQCGAESCRGYMFT